MSGKSRFLNYEYEVRHIWNGNRDGLLYIEMVNNKCSRHNVITPVFLLSGGSAPLDMGTEVPVAPHDPARGPSCVFSLTSQHDKIKMSKKSMETGERVQVI